MQHDRCSRGAGFTLLELLVAIALIGVVGAVLVPALMAQLSNWNDDRLAADLDAVADAAAIFRMDVGRWPGSLADLAVTPPPGALDLDGRPYPATASLRWSGPYLERSRMVGPALATVDGGEIRALAPADGSLLIEVAGVSAEVLAELDTRVDGAAGPEAGRVRIGTDSAGATLLSYRARSLSAGAPAADGAEALAPPPPAPGPPPPAEETGAVEEDGRGGEPSTTEPASADPPPATQPPVGETDPEASAPPNLPPGQMKKLCEWMALVGWDPGGWCEEGKKGSRD